MSYWFFMSYARLDYSPSVKTFYNDLAAKIRLLEGGPLEETGFFDLDKIKNGDAWTENLTEALQTSRAFVPIYSASYFSGQFCGKEWEVFRSRVAAFVEQSRPGTKRPASISPVLWVPEDAIRDRLPEAARNIQYKHSDFGELYAKEGVFQLMTVAEYKDEYLKFLQRFATSLINQAKLQSLPRIEGNLLSEAQSAFHVKDRKAGADKEEANSGPRYVKFIFVVGDKNELQTARKQLNAYGSQGGRDWRPYYPDSTNEMGRLALRCSANDEDTLDHEVIHVKGSLLPLLEEAERKKNVVIMVVDTWTLQVSKYHESIREYDDRSFVNCAVLVPWNKTDEETTKKITELESLVRSAFRKRIILNDPICILDRINTADDLESELRATFNKVRMRLMEYAAVEKPVNSDQKIAIISGPGGSQPDADR